MHQYCSPCDRPLPAGLQDAMITQCEYCSLPVAARFPLQRAPHRANLLQIAVKRVQEVIWNQAVVNETSSCSLEIRQAFLRTERCFGTATVRLQPFTRSRSNRLALHSFAQTCRQCSHANRNVGFNDEGNPESPMIRGPSGQRRTKAASYQGAYCKRKADRRGD